MNKDEFIKLCKVGGYANKKVASEYCKTKDEFDDSDLIKVFRISQRNEDLKVDNSGKWRNYKGVKSTKRLNYTDCK